MVLSIVIISKNEEINIERCINSILRLKIKFSYEVILVDSNSSDATKKIAEKYDIKIYDLGPNIHHSVAMGRYVGSRFSTGEYILFLDADMEISQETNLQEALKCFQISREIVCISGSLEEYVYREKKIIKSNLDVYKVHKNEQRYDMGGVFLFKKEILFGLGNVNIKLDNNEDLELMYRLYYKGYMFYRTPHIKVIHHTKDALDFKVINSRFRNGRYRDMWTVAWLSIKYNFFIHHVLTNNFVFLWSSLLTVTFVLFILAFLLNYLLKYCYAFGVIYLLLILYKIIKKKSLRFVVLDFYYATMAFLSIFQRNNNSETVSLDQVKIYK